MVCTTITIVQAKPVVSNLVATPRANQQGWVDLSWSQDIAGNITISVDSVTVNQGGYAAGTNTNVLSGLAVGSHSICVAAT
jgi:hypothetical protein